MKNNHNFYIIVCLSDSEWIQKILFSTFFQAISKQTQKVNKKKKKMLASKARQYLH